MGFLSNIEVPSQFLHPLFLKTFLHLFYLTLLRLASLASSLPPCSGPRKDYPLSSINAFVNYFPHSSTAPWFALSVTAASSSIRVHGVCKDDVHRKMKKKKQTCWLPAHRQSEWECYLHMSNRCRRIDGRPRKKKWRPIFFTCNN